MDSPGRQRELVYCHQCENEWYRDEHGLVCPRCTSDAVEIIDEAHDPRDDLRIPEDDDDDPPISLPPQAPTNPLRDHNPWHDRDEDDGLNRLRWESIGPGRFRVTGTYVRRFPANPGPDHQPDAYDPFESLARNFQTMVAGMLTNNPNGPAPGRPNGPSVHVRSGTMPGGVYTTTTRIRDGSPMGANLPVDDLHRQVAQFAISQDFVELTTMHRLLATQLFNNNMHMQDGQAGPPGFANNPLAILLPSLLNPGAARHGDAVYTQEALDRVISQLMEQNNMGNAPPPASASDISQLPRVRITKDMMDPTTGKASCSICMDDVAVGDEVMRLWCSHWFHESCVEAWLKEHDSCPQCRKGIKEARDEAQGRGSGPDNGSHQNVAGGTDSPLPTMPGAFGFSSSHGGSPDPRSPDGSRQNRGTPNDGQQSQGFADRVRGLFGRTTSNNGGR